MIYKLKFKKQALRPLQIRVPETRRNGFAEECRRQSRATAKDPHEQEVMEWIETVT